MTCWFKRHEEDPWRAGEIIHWSHRGESRGNRSYTEPVAVVCELGTNWVYATPLEWLNVEADISRAHPRPTEPERPDSRPPTPPELQIDMGWRQPAEASTQ